MDDDHLNAELKKARAERDAAVAKLETAEAANVRQLRLLMEEQDRFIEGLLTRHEEELRNVRSAHEEELASLRREVAQLIAERAQLIDRIARDQSELAMARTLLDAAMDVSSDPAAPARPIRSGFVAKKGAKDTERPSERPTLPPDPRTHGTIRAGGRRTATGGKPRSKPPSR